MNPAKDKVKPLLRIGDLLWCREGRQSHVWWPAMVTYEPKSGIYYKSVANRVSQYHVQYFGITATRGWVFLHSTQECKDAKEKLLPERGVSKRKQKEFEVAIQEVSEALLLERKQRKLKFIFSFEPEPTGRVEQPPPSLPPAKKETVPPVKESVLHIDKVEKSAKKPPKEVETKISRKSQRCSQPDQAQPTCTPKSPVISPRVADVKKIASPEPPRVVDLGKITSPKQRVSALSNEPLVSPMTIERVVNPCAIISEEEQSLEMDLRSSTFQPIHRANVLPISRTDGVSDSSVVATTPDEACEEQSLTVSFKRNPAKPSSSHTRRNVRRVPPLGTKRRSDSCGNDVESRTPSKRPALDLTESAPIPVPMSDSSSEASAPSITSAILTPPNSSEDESQTSGNFYFEQRSDVRSAAAHDGGPQELAVKPKKEAQKKKSGCSFKSGICCICDAQDSDLLMCEGHCFHLFHLDCLGLLRPPAFQFVCDECLTTSSQCYVCRNSDGALQKCSRFHCSKSYHLNCIRGSKLFVFSESGKSFVCPLHHCARCTSIGVSEATQKSSELIQCIQCPLALHRQDCLVAGCEIIDATHMVCYQHISIERRATLYSHMNLNTCLECGDMGSLFCCDFCSAAYHEVCLDEEARPFLDAPTWKCPNCTVHDLPTYGSMVLCKFSKWRWWPGEIVFPSDIPSNLVRKKPGRCMFVVKFCGSRDYGWIYHGRAIPYAATVEEGGEGESAGVCKAMRVVGGHCSTTEGVFAKAHKEAAELYKSKVAAREEKQQRHKKPESKVFYRIKSNKYLVPRPVGGWANSLPCQCTPENPCKEDSVCFNRASHIECDSKSCPVGKLCQNQRMLRNQYADTYPFYTGSRGWGLKAKHDISSGDFVVEYVGEILDKEMCKERLRKSHENHTSNFYMLTLEPGLVIDASQKSNNARFINHSCDPNCETQKWTVRGETRIGIFARMDIATGNELTFDYQFDSLGNEKKKCLCGSKNCSGFLGLKLKAIPSRDKSERNREKVKAKPKKKKSKKKWSDKPIPSAGGRATQLEEAGLPGKEGGEGADANSSHEDDCFVCGDGGKLLMCDRKACSKVYHLACIGRKLTPAQNMRWECPRHYCKTCQKKASAFCTSCPVSYCDRHSEGKFVDHESGHRCLLNCDSMGTMDTQQ